MTKDNIAINVIMADKSTGFVELWNRKELLSLLVKKEINVRYRNSFLGLLWSYFKPMLIFIVQYFIIGIILNRSGVIENYALYMFSGNILITYFSESFSNATRSIIWNADLIKKIYLPREFFPIACICVSAIHFIPALFILTIAAIYKGWLPSLYIAAGLFISLLIVTLFSVGLGLITSALNVFYRDVENIVDLFGSIVMWMSPVIYTWDLIANRLTNFGLFIYMSNPLTTTVEIFHYIFWYPTINNASTFMYTLPPHFLQNIIVAFFLSCITLCLGSYIFKKLEGQFAQEL